MTSLNPVFRIGFQVDEVIKLHNPEMSKEEVKKRTLEMLELVGIANKEGVYEMYPHELSGGMRQRIMIAIALSCNPELIIADEPTTALDVTIQAQILDLLKELKDKMSSSIMLITHDLGVVANMADYVVVMYAGRVIERGTARDIFSNPCHPYTIGLMKSKPVVGRKVEELYNIPGSVPNPINMPDYCYFKDRCEMCVEKCNGKHSHPSQYQRPFQNPLRSLAVAGDVDAVNIRKRQEQKEAGNNLTYRQEIDKYRKHKHRKHIVPEAHEIGGEQELIPDFLRHRARLHIIIHCRNIPLHHHLHDDIRNQHTDNDTSSQQGRHVFVPKFSPILGEAEKEAHAHHHIQEDDVARHEGISLMEVTALLQPPKP